MLGISLAKKLLNVRHVFGVIAALISLCAALLYIFLVARSEFEIFANFDNTSMRWKPYEAELRHLELLYSLNSVVHLGDVPLGSVYRDFSRFRDTIHSLSYPSPSNEMLERFRSQYNLKQIEAYLEKWAPFVENVDTSLSDEISQLLSETNAIKPDVRALAKSGVDYFARQQDMQSMKLKIILTRDWAIFSALTLMLVILVIVLGRLNIRMKSNTLLIEQDRKRMAAIVSASLDAIILTNSDGHICEYNDAAEHIFGWKRCDAIGMKLEDFFDTTSNTSNFVKSSGRESTDFFRVNSGRGRIRLGGYAKCGNRFPTEVVIVSASQTDPSMVIFVRDISSEVEAEATLRNARDNAIASEKSKSRLLAVMSHEIRTPLNGLMGSIELLDDTALSGAQRHHVQNMKKAGGVLLEQVNDVLDISRLEADHEVMQIEEFDLISLITETVGIQYALAKERGNKLLFETTGVETFLVAADRLKLGRMILNILSNANKFTENGEIRVEVDKLPLGGFIEIRVSDTGIGIASDDVTRIFEDFVTLDSSFQRNAEGTGLGLGIAQRLARAMGGDITVESELGSGSMFTISVPITLPDTAKKLDTPLTRFREDTADIIPRLDILIVEDNELNRMVARDMLMKGGHDVTLARNGYEGISVASDQKFDAIFMDISMPDIDGTQVTQTIRQSDGPNSETPIFALTAHATPDDKALFFSVGMNDVLVKPATSDVLRKALQTVALSNGADRNSPMLIDQRTLDMLLDDLGKEFFQRLLDKFVGEIDTVLPNLKAMEADQAARSLHQLAGSAAMFGALRLRECLRVLEANIGGFETEKLDQHFTMLKTIWEGTKIALIAYKSKI